MCVRLRRTDPRAYVIDAGAGEREKKWATKIVAETKSYSIAIATVPVRR